MRILTCFYMLLWEKYKVYLEISEFSGYLIATQLLVFIISTKNEQSLAYLAMFIIELSQFVIQSSDQPWTNL